MRISLAPVVLLLCLGPLGGARAAEDLSLPPQPETRETTGPAFETLTRAQQIDALLETLKTTKDDAVAVKAENSLAGLWLQSDSATVDLMMHWVSAAMTSKNYPLALDYLDRILTLKPDYAEGWNARATVYFLNNDYSRALFDLDQVLKIEPRHFDALAGLGAVLREMGKDREALAVFEQALALDPHLDSVATAAAELRKKGVDGRAL
jgi:tetratricopeptide (TPR) repeat protein